MRLFNLPTSESFIHISYGCPGAPHQECSISSGLFPPRDRSTKRATFLATASHWILRKWIISLSMIDWSIEIVCPIVNVFLSFLILFPQDLSSEDVQEVYADDEGTVPDRVLPLLERYSLNTTLNTEEHLTTDEIARKCTRVRHRILPSIVLISVQGIGILATQLVSESDSPLETLRQLVQNFPRYATSLSRRVIPQSGLLQEITSNSRKIQPGVSAVWLNGVQLSAEDMNPQR
jgi:Thioredoxin-like domain